MRVALTGATGFTGRRVARLLIERGHDVRALVRPPLERAAAIVPSVCEVRAGDMADAVALDALLAGCDAFVHFASLGFGHAEGITRALERAGTQRAVFCSSTSLFTKLPARSKTERMKAEDLIRRLSLSWTLVRPTMIYGDEGDRNLSRLIRFLAHAPLVPLPGGGRALVQPVHVDDLALAAVDALESPRSAKREYNLSGAAPVPLRDVVRFVLTELGRRVPVVPLPIAPMALAVGLWELTRLPPRLTKEQVLRLAEDKAFAHEDARADWGYAPRGYLEGLRTEIARLRAIGWIR
jgi:uncharacterized protein YbjT (DUF2867 family)